MFEKVCAVEARRPFRGRATGNHDCTLRCSSWLSVGFSNTVGVRYHTPSSPGCFWGLPGGTFRDGNELREETDGTKEEAHVCDSQGVGGLLFVCFLAYMGSGQP